LWSTGGFDEKKATWVEKENRIDVFLFSSSCAARRCLYKKDFFFNSWKS